MAPRKQKDGDESPQANLNSQTAQEELRQFVEVIERLQSDAKGVAEDIKEKFAEAKGRGYDTKVLRRVIAERKRKADDIAEEEAVLDMYRFALGMIPGGSSSDDLV